MARTTEYDIGAELNTSSLLTFWGQFMDHDLTFSLDSSTYNQCVPFLITIPKGDPFFDSASLGGQTMSFCRLIVQNGTGTNASNPLQFPNICTAWVDGSQVYGYTNQRINALRSFTGGLMKTSTGVDGDYLPLNSNGNGGALIDMANAAAKVPATSLYAAGDLRANENPVLLSLHTTFLREHNRKAKLLAAANPSWNDEQVFQTARVFVISLIQKITYEDFLPIILGTPLPAYPGYDSTVNPNIAEFFSTAAYRFGHDMLTDVLPRLDQQGKSIPQGTVLLRDGFFDIASFNPFGASTFLRGTAVDPQRPVDCIVEDDIRLFLYGQGPATATDLVSRNMQRARDIGMGFYNDARTAYGLTPCTTFSCVTSDPTAISALNTVYGVNNVSFLDSFVGGLLEPKNPKAKLGALFSAALVDQFTRIRNGDRFFYLNPGVLSTAALAEVKSTTLSQIMQRNGDSTTMPVDAFNRQNVAPDVIYNPPNNTPWIIAIVILTVVAAILIIIVIGMCFTRSSNKVQDNQLYTNLVTEEVN